MRTAGLRVDEAGSMLQSELRGRLPFKARWPASMAQQVHKLNGIEEMARFIFLSNV